MTKNIKIGVLGAGTWGIALARLLQNAGHAVTVWSAIEHEIDYLAANGCHPQFPECKLPKQIQYTKDISVACSDRDMIVFAVPSPFVRATARRASPYVSAGQIVVDVAKGIEENTFCTMSEIIAEELQNPEIRIVALSGPTHAEEVIKDLPTAIVSACSDIEAAKYVQGVFNTDFFRVYTNNDIRGVELCGALKNIIAVACGIAHGIGCGDNAKAALITLGIEEMSRLGRAMGCKEQTFAGLSGIGDLIVTATSMHSRNFQCGILLGKGVPIQEALLQVGMVVEGINTLPAAIMLAQKHHIQMPIIETVNAVVSEKIDESEIIRLLMPVD
ncbi:MAG: NAD(P)-dependent glycerol-3-phosphate dehydrogenase [Clostridia bacterium]|nr:NAD(P)-dependent glycerol-3-phosphate dehydrogenase [Clostridia bacterium]